MFTFSDRLSPLIACVIKVSVSCLICKQNAEIALEVMNYSKDNRAMIWTDSVIPFLRVMQISNVFWDNSKTKLLVFERENKHNLNW